MNKPSFIIELWGSEPDTADDHHTNYDFDNLASALRAFEDHEEYMRANSLHGVTHLRLCRITVECGQEYADVLEVRQIMTDADIRKMNAAYARDDSWMRETAMQAGMGLGIQAYNDHMGY